MADPKNPYGEKNSAEYLMRGAAWERCADAYRPLLAEARREIERLREQLPLGMQGCTIRLHECVVGHTWLSADNWVEKGCLKCALDSQTLQSKRLSDEVAELELEKQPDVDGWWGASKDRIAELEERVAELVARRATNERQAKSMTYLELLAEDVPGKRVRARMVSCTLEERAVLAAVRAAGMQEFEPDTEDPATGDGHLYTDDQIRIVEAAWAAWPELDPREKD